MSKSKPVVGTKKASEQPIISHFVDVWPRIVMANSHLACQVGYPCWWRGRVISCGAKGHEFESRQEKFSSSDYHQKSLSDKVVHFVAGTLQPLSVVKKWWLLLCVCWSLTSLCHSNRHIETMPAREINPFTALTRIRSQFLRTQWSTSNHSAWTQLRIRPLSHRGWLKKWWCFRPPLCTLFRLNWVRQTPGIMRRN